jgi:hypothetical protein
MVTILAPGAQCTVLRCEVSNRFASHARSRFRHARRRPRRRRVPGGRDGTFHWRLKGRFLDRDTATGTVSGKAEIRMGRHVVSRCKIARAGTVRLTLGG